MVEYEHAPVAQWIRASVFGTEGRRFESYPVYHDSRVSVETGGKKNSRGLRLFLTPATPLIFL